MMHWNPRKNQYELPPGRRTGPITKLFWALEDRWRTLEPVDKTTIKFLVSGAILWLLLTRPW